MRIEATMPTGNVGFMVRGYAPRANEAVVVSSPRGVSINAADLNIPGVGKGILPGNGEYIPSFPQNDEYVPSFPQGAAFRPPYEMPEAQAVAAENSGADGETVGNDTAEGRAREDAVSKNEKENDAGELTAEEQKIVADLQARDREVRAHEQAHISAGGQYITGGATYEYERGPDDKRYAVGGEVGIDSSPIRDNPEATIAKMQVVRAAALAPAEPSAQDRAVASAAAREEARASAELRDRRMAEARGDTDNNNSRQISQTIDLVA